MIDILQKIDDQKIFLRLQYSSLFDYAVKALKLSEANASNFITVARKSKTVPELKNAIIAGEITVSKARKITPVITAQNQKYWIDLAKNLPKAKLEQEVAKVMPETAVQERMRFVAASRIELKVGLSEALTEKLKRAQDLVRCFCPGDTLLASQNKTSGPSARSSPVQFQKIKQLFA